MVVRALTRSTSASITITEKRVKTNSVLRKKKWVFLIFKLIYRLYIYIYIYIYIYNLFLLNLE